MARRRRIVFRVFAVLVAIAAIAAVVVPRARFDREGWLRDFEQLIAHTSAVYANLEWQRDRRQVDLRRLHDDTRRAIEEASTDGQATAVIHSFIDAFHDGHFRIKRVKLSKRLEKWWNGRSAPPAAVTPPAGASPPQAAPGIPASTSSDDACAQLGFVDEPATFPFSLPAAAEVRNVGAFPIAMASEGTRRVGMVRIASFTTEKFSHACRSAWRQWQTRASSAVPSLAACDDDCQRAFRYVDVPNQILANLTRAIDELKAANVELLAVDISRNGGGTDWVDAAARIVTSQRLGCPRMAFIKHDHWRRRFARMRDEIAPKLGAGPFDDTIRARLSQLVGDANQQCDRSGLWRGADPGCTLLGTEPYYACGLVERLDDGVLQGSPVRSDVWDAAAFKFTSGAWSGPLAVIVDERTASAAEHFAAILQDESAATIVGRRTDGSGCGYTDKGLPLTLEYSGLKIEMPDCARFRRDGTNEIEGITPNVVIDDFGAELLHALARIDAN